MSAAILSQGGGPVDHRRLALATRRIQHLPEHRGRGRFSVGPGDGHAAPRGQDPAQGLEVAQHGNAQLRGLPPLGVVGRDGVAGDEHVGVGGRFSAACPSWTLTRRAFRKRRRGAVQVRAAERPSPAQEHASQRPHPRAGDAHQVGPAAFAGAADPVLGKIVGQGGGFRLGDRGLYASKAHGLRPVGFTGCGASVRMERRTRLRDDGRPPSCQRMAESVPLPAGRRAVRTACQRN